MKRCFMFFHSNVGFYSSGVNVPRDLSGMFPNGKDQLLRKHGHGLALCEETGVEGFSYLLRVEVKVGVGARSNTFKRFWAWPWPGIVHPNLQTKEVTRSVRIHMPSQMPTSKCLQSPSQSGECGKKNSLGFSEAYRDV